MASDSRIMLSNCLTVIRKLLFPGPPSSCLNALYFSTNTAEASGVSYQQPSASYSTLSSLALTFGLNVLAYRMYR